MLLTASDIRFILEICNFTNLLSSRELLLSNVFNLDAKNRLLIGSSSRSRRATCTHCSIKIEE